MKRRQPRPAGIDPDPLRTPDDATETGLIIGATGGTPWYGVVIKNAFDAIRSFRDDDGDSGLRDGVKRAGKAAGKASGTRKA